MADARFPRHPQPELPGGLGVVEGPESPALEEMPMYGQTRIAVLDRATDLAGRAARAGRWFLHLAARPGGWRPTDLYAAAATARYMAAHRLIDQAAAEAADDPETDVVQIRQPIWFGGTTIHEEETQR